jgi:sterol-4alpha-carboxylate 3-dehydrogenase (decarboxylating)
LPLSQPYTLSLPADTAARAAAIRLPEYPALRGASVAVVGGGGFLGRHLVDALLGAGARVCVLDAAPAPAPGASAAAYTRVDICDGAAVAAALAAAAPAVVLHCASPPALSADGALLARVNVDGTAAVLAGARSAGARGVVYTSSASVVWRGRPQAGPDEAAAPVPPAHRDAYAASKARGEALALAANGPGFATVALRPHAIFGPRDALVVPALVAAARAGRARWVLGDGANVVDWTFVGNVVHAHLLAAAAVAGAAGGAPPPRAAGRAYFVTNGAPLPFWRFTNSVLLGLGYEPARARLPAAVAGAAAAAAAAAAALCGGGAPQLTARTVEMATLTHHYSCAAAASDLGYAPLWDMPAALFLTLRAFAHLRNPRPGPLALANARRGGLVALKLVDDAAAAAARAAPAPAAPAPAARAGGTRGAAVAATAAADLPGYTAADVARHCARDDLWVVIDGLVYDLTAYVDPHPGGDAILAHAGGDATRGFLDNPSHPSHVFETVKQFQVGRLVQG